MRTSLLVFLALSLACSAGCAGRFNTLSSGTYACTATLTTNTCDEVLASPATYSSPLQGGGSDTIAIEVPSSQSRFRGEVATETVQFGAQADPNRYAITSGTTCRPSTGGPGSMPFVVSTAIDAQLASVGDDTLEIRLTHTYPDFSECTETTTMAGPCEMAWTVVCSRTP